MKVTLHKQKDTTVLNMENENKFYVLNHEEVYEAAINQLESNASTVKINFSSIQYIDSSAFNTIIKLHRYSKELDKELIMLNVKGAAYRLFDILRLTEVLNFESPEELRANQKEAVTL